MRLLKIKKAWDEKLWNYINSHELLYLQRALAAMINQVHCLKIEGYREKNRRNNILILLYNIIYIIICKHKILSSRFLYNNKFCWMNILCYYNKYNIFIIFNVYIYVYNIYIIFTWCASSEVTIYPSRGGPWMEATRVISDLNCLNLNDVSCLLAGCLCAIAGQWDLFAPL